jgi:hypothetical protein
VLEQPSLIVRTDCKHDFHKVCLDKWMLQKTKHVKAVFHGLPVFDPKTIRRRGRRLPQKQMMVPTCPLCKVPICFPQLDVVGTYEPEEASDDSAQVEVIDLTTDDDDDEMDQSGAAQAVVVQPGTEEVMELLDSGAAQPVVVQPEAEEVVDLLDAMRIQEDDVPIDNPPTGNLFAATVGKCFEHFLLKCFITNLLFMSLQLHLLLCWRVSCLLHPSGKPPAFLRPLLLLPCRP